MAGKKSISRRQFVRSAAIVSGSMAAVGALSGFAPVPPPEKWDKEADVVVVGGGGAGLAAAIEAVDAGASVVLLEKMPYLGGHTWLSVGNFAAAGTSLQKAAKIEDSADQHLEDILHADPRANPESIRILVDHAADSFEWLVELGVPFHETPVLRPHDTNPRAHMANPDARVFAQVLGKVAKDKGVEIMVETAAKRLIVDADGTVVGLLATDDGGDEIAVKATRAVVLASGDYAASQQLKAKYSSPAIAALACRGNPGNTGDGLLMAMALGADPVCLDGCGSPAGLSVNKVPGDTGFSPDLMNAGAIVVNKEGKRFADELGDIAAESLNQPDQEAWCIFGQEVADEHVWLSTGRYLEDWQKHKAVVEAPTLEELAEAIEMDPDQLQSTLDKWNASVEAGTDAEFGRTVLGKGIREAPFYALGPAKTYVTLVDGTLMVDTTHRVLNVFGEVIPRLYAAGDMGKSGKVALHGTHVAWAFVSGRRAGKNAAAEKPLA